MLSPQDIITKGSEVWWEQQGIEKVLKLCISEWQPQYAQLRKKSEFSTVASETISKPVMENYNNRLLISPGPGVGLAQEFALGFFYAVEAEW